MLQRTVIRKAVQARLLSGARTRAQGRVLTTKVTPWRTSQLPGISIYTLSDPVDVDSRQTAPRLYQRNLELKVELALALTDSIDDQLDAFEEEVRKLLEPDPQLRDQRGEPQASDLFLVGSEMHVEPQAEQPVGSLILTYQVSYTDEARTDPSALVPFRTADIHTSLGDAQAAADQAHDVATMETDP